MPRGRALLAGDAPAAQEAMTRARGKILMWAERLPPGPRVQRIFEEADRPTYGGDIATLRQSWEQLKTRMKPGAD
jgi:hypothetical protein